MKATTAALKRIPNRDVVFCCLAGCENVRVEGEHIVGNWSDSPHLVVQGNRRGALAEEVVNAIDPSPERIVALTRKFGPMNIPHAGMELHFNLTFDYSLAAGPIPNTLRLVTQEEMSKVVKNQLKTVREQGFKFSIEGWLGKQGAFQAMWELRAYMGGSKVIDSDMSSQGGRFIRLQGDRMFYLVDSAAGLLVLDHWNGSNRARVCENPECSYIPFFVAEHLNQRYCSKDCSDWAQREHRRKWWAAHGKEMRERQKAAKKKQNKQTGRKK